MCDRRNSVFVSDGHTPCATARCGTPTEGAPMVYVDDSPLCVPCARRTVDDAIRTLSALRRIIPPEP